MIELLDLRSITNPFGIVHYVTDISGRYNNYTPGLSGTQISYILLLGA